jgi:hypothetical protein
MTGGPRLSSLSRGRAGLRRHRAARVRPAHAFPRVVRTPRMPPPGLFKAAAAPWTPPPEPPLALAASRPNPRAPPPPLFPGSAAASSPWDHPGAAQGGEELPGAACCHPRATRRPRTVAGVRAPRHRVDRPCRRVFARAAALDRSTVLRASRRCLPCVESWLGALDWGLTGEPAAQRCRSRSPPAQRRRPAACSRLAPSDRDPTPLINPAAPLRPHATTAIRSRSNGSRSSQPESAGQTRRQPWQFCRKAPEFLIFTKIPFHLISFLIV